MAKVELRTDLKLASATLAAIDAAVLAAADDGQRPHLGASVIGRECSRALWYSWRWATRPAHEPRVLRLFARGQREEDSLADLLRQAGVQVVQVDPNTGRQYSFSAIGGHFGGSMDGACVRLPDAPKTWHVLEFKTHGAKSFNELIRKGVLDAKPEHWAQMQCYMAWTGMTRALYVAVCKDDDRLHMERIDADKDAAEALMARAQRIISSPVPPDGISEDPEYFGCRWCDHQALCHGTAVPQPTCRSCTHATPELDGAGRWSCGRHAGKTIAITEQKVGCAAHRFIPVLLQRFADPVDASEQDNWVRYAMKDGAGEFVNGQPPEGFDSAEINACEHKQMLVDAQLLQLRRKHDGARVTA